jgi:hypothetical protein
MLDAFRVMVDWYPLEELGYLETRFRGTNRPVVNNNPKGAIIILYF